MHKLSMTHIIIMMMCSGNLQSYPSHHNQDCCQNIPHLMTPWYSQSSPSHPPSILCPPQLRQTQTRTEGWVMIGSGARAGAGGGGGGDFPIYINLPSIFLSPRDNPSLFKLVDNFVNFYLLRFK